jgi:protein-tyrosine phosphatase
MHAENMVNMTREQHNERIRPLPESYWVRPGSLLAGETPGAWDANVARRKLRRIIAAGVNTILDLTQAVERGARPYLPLLGDLDPALISYTRMAIRDHDVPSVHEMREILDALDEMLARGRFVYVHCRGGIGRTGTVIGCYLVRHGLTGEAAINHIAALRHATPDGHRPSPETASQREMVLAWSSEERRDAPGTP